MFVCKVANWRRLSPMFWLSLALIFWFICEAPWISSVPVNILNESVLHQSDIFELSFTLHNQGLLAFLSALTHMNGPCSPLTDLLTIIAIEATPFGAWPFFLVQFFFMAALILGIYQLGALLYGAKSGLYSALIASSLVCLEAYLRSTYIDFSLASILVWTYWSYLKSQNLSQRRYCAIFYGLILAGSLAKWSYVPLYLGVFLLYAAIKLCTAGTTNNANKPGTADTTNNANKPGTAGTTNNADKSGTADTTSNADKSCGTNQLSVAGRASITIKRRLAENLLWALGCATLAYLLYYRQAWDAVFTNYHSCVSFKPDRSYLMQPAYYWHSLGKYLLLLMRNDFLGIAGQLFIFSGLWSCFDSRFRANRPLIWLFIVPSFALVFLNFEFAVPRYLVPCIGLQCVIMGSILAKVRYAGASILGLLLAMKLTFLLGWLTPLPLAHCTYDYLDSDALGVCDSVNAFQENDPYTLRRLGSICFSNQHNWARGYFFTSPPYRQEWMERLNAGLDTALSQTSSQILTFSDIMRDNVALRCAVNCHLHERAVKNIRVQNCFHWDDVKTQLLTRTDGAFDYLVLALSIETTDDNFRDYASDIKHEQLRFYQGHQTPERRRAQVQDTLRRELGAQWQISAYIPNLRSRVVPRATMSHPFDLYILSRAPQSPSPFIMRR